MRIQSFTRSEENSLNVFYLIRSWLKFPAKDNSSLAGKPKKLEDNRAVCSKWDEFEITKRSWKKCSLKLLQNFYTRDIR